MFYNFWILDENAFIPEVICAVLTCVVTAEWPKILVEEGNDLTLLDPKFPKEMNELA